MKGIDDMQFYCDTTSGDKFVGRVAEFPDLRTKPKTSRLDAVDDIISLTSRRMREIGSPRNHNNESELP